MGRKGCSRGCAGLLALGALALGGGWFTWNVYPSLNRERVVESVRAGEERAIGLLRAAAPPQFQLVKPPSRLSEGDIMTGYRRSLLPDLVTLFIDYEPFPAYDPDRGPELSATYRTPLSGDETARLLGERLGDPCFPEPLRVARAKPIRSLRGLFGRAADGAARTGRRPGHAPGLR
jgi:hypothetical protein